VTAVRAEGGIGPTICDARAIAQAIERLAANIAADYSRQPLLLLGVLRGALCFTVDLARRLAGRADGPSEIMVDYIVVERYGSLGISGGQAHLRMDCGLPIEGSNALVVDDIVDTGHTLEFVQALIERRRPASLRRCVLFDRPARREIEVPIDYSGIAVPNVFAIGYGLDYKELYRNLPHLAELREGKTV
jgi:hypoxanthine phosphoribosyltransferase